MASLLPVLKLSLGILAAFFAGYNMILFLFRNNLEKLGLSETIFLSFPIGVSFITLEMYLLALLGKEWSFANLAAPWACLFLINLIWLFTGKRTILRSAGKRAALGLVEKALVCGIALQVIYVVLKAFTLPIEAPDAVAIYAMKAKAFYLKGGIDHGILTDPVFKESHQDYPLLLPLAECLVYKVVGSLNDLLAKAIFPLYFLSTLAIFYNVLKRFVSRRGSILFTFMLSSIPQFAVFGTNGYADLLVACYYTASILYLFLWMKEKATPYLLLSALMSFSAAWTKNEGWMLSAVNVVILMMFLAGNKMKPAKKVLSLSVYIGLMLVLIAPWILLKANLGLESDLINKATVTPARIAGNMGRIWPILYEYQKHIFGPKRWNIVWLLVLFVFAVKCRSIFTGENKYLAFSILFCILGYTFIYIISPHVNLTWHISTSASRLILHFLPVSMFWLALSTKRELDIF